MRASAFGVCVCVVACANYVFVHLQVQTDQTVIIVRAHKRDDSKNRTHAEPKTWCGGHAAKTRQRRETYGSRAVVELGVREDNGAVLGVAGVVHEVQRGIRLIAKLCINGMRV